MPLFPTQPGARSGVSLAETLIALALLGVVMIPVLFASSAFFTGKLAGVREKVGVSHDASVFLNRFMEELYYTHRLLDDSTDTEIHFAYADPVSQDEVRRGYRLEAAADGSGDLVLKRLSYNGTDWNTETSPYAVTDPESIHLPAAAIFKYCQTSACATAVTPEKALFVRLDGWAFSPTGGGYTLDLPVNVDLYVSGGASGGVMLSEAPQALYSFSGSSAFGGGADLDLLVLNSNGSQLKYLSEVSSGTSGSLSIILSDGAYPGDGHAVAATSGGRVYFGDTTKFWSWKESTGLSTVGTGLGTPGANSQMDDNYDTYTPTIAIASDEGVFFGEQTGSLRMLYWKDGVLTVVGTSSDVGGESSITVDDQDRFYYGECDYGSDLFRTWKPGSALSVIATGSCLGFASTQAFPGGGVVFGDDEEQPNSKIRKWTPGGGLVEIAINDGAGLGERNLRVESNGRLYFTHRSDVNNRLWTWKNGTLTTIISTNTPYLARRAMVVSSDGDTVFFGADNNPGNFWVWENTGGSGTLTTILSNVNRPGAAFSYALAADNRIFFATQGAGQVYTWKKTTGLSVITPSSVSNPGSSRRIAYSDGAQRLFFTTRDGAGSDKMYTWHETDGLSVIMNINTHFTGERPFQTTANGRVFFGSYGAGTSYWTWKKDTGLSTILASGNSSGFRGASAYSEVAGRMFFGERTGSGTSKFYTWKEANPQGQLSHATSMGSKAGSNLTIEFERDPSYSAAVQDEDGALYFLDTTAKTVDRYVYSTDAYRLANSLDWTGNATTVSAIAVDKAGTSIALLDSGNMQIDVYTSRTVDGAATPSSSLSLAATTTPTGLARSSRSGNYLVLDSALQGGTSVRLFVFNSAGTQISGSPIAINVTAANLGVSATTESSFRVAYDEQKNLLYLIAPTLDRIYALTLPTRL